MHSFLCILTVPTNMTFTYRINNNSWSKDEINAFLKVIDWSEIFFSSIMFLRYECKISFVLLANFLTFSYYSRSSCETLTPDLDRSSIWGP